MSEIALAKRCSAEFIGTFILVFAGTAAIVVNAQHNNLITHPGIAMVFGLTVSAIIYMLGDISGAHINPAVTIGFWRAGRFPGKEVLPYGISQLSGALLASVLVNFLVATSTDTTHLGATLPAQSLLQAFCLETLLAFILMFAIMNVATGAKEKGMMAGLTIGAVVCVEALFAGPVTGASMNPARSFGPSIMSGQISLLWLYFLAPITGAILATYSCRFIRDQDCCQ